MDCTANCVHRQWFLEVFLSPCSDFQYKIIPVFNAVLPEGRKSRSIPYLPLALSFVHRDFSRFSKSIDDIMYYRCWDIQSLHNFTLWNIFLKLFHNFSTQFFADWWTSAHLYFWETLPLWNAPFKPSHVTDLLPINLISYKMLPQLFLISTTYFSSLLLPVPSFLRCVAAIKLKMS